MKCCCQEINGHLRTHETKVEQIKKTKIEVKKKAKINDRSKRWKQAKDQLVCIKAKEKDEDVEEGESALWNKNDFRLQLIDR